MSAQEEVQFSIRPEVEIAADAVWALFERGIIARSKELILAASEASGVPVRALRDAALRYERGYWRKPAEERPALTLVQPDEPERASEPGPMWHDIGRARTQPAPTVESQRPGNRARFAAKNPVPGMRVCCRCDELQPVTNFHIRNRKTGNRSAMCKPCAKEYQRQRYLSVEDTARLGTVLRFIVEHGDNCEGIACPDCGKPMSVGQEVAAFDVTIRHLNCLDAARGEVVLP